MTDPISVLIADDQPVVVRALANVLSNDPTVEVVATATGTDEAIALAQAHRPVVALLDVRMPGGGGARAARQIRARTPGTNILALSAYDDRSSVIEMIRAGALGYVVKGSKADEVLEAVRRTARGESGLSPEAAAGVVGELSERLGTEEQEAALRRERTARIRDALRGEGLEMAFQPLIDLPSGACLGFEALARFHGELHRDPGAWFTEAASVGLGTELEVSTARLALSKLDRLPADAFLSLNVSPDTVISPTMLELLASVDVRRVVIEITEHARVHDYDVLSRALGELRPGGLRLAVDDAGAGFASLRHILRLAPDLIKLDITITRAIKTRPAHALAAALKSFAVEMGALIVAEGIETEEELRILRRLGVDLGQGYHLGRPGPLPTSDEIDPRLIHRGGRPR